MGDSPTPSFRLCGYLLPSAPDEARILLESFVLTISRADILEVVEKPIAGWCETVACRVELVVARGARLLSVDPSFPYASLLPRGHRPFSFSARRDPPIARPAPKYREIERAWLARSGLMEYRTDDARPDHLG